ncbi:hypothetical protein LAh9_30 [Aeromonas phage LAh_9]|uniref:Uncharacterized protein n=3 Tax=Lahexavirus TaxID=2843411 RepID=A0A514A116_9CAUD|nr:hypothetical protein HWC30_gp140 [Aeromonas phage LAh_6]YP_009847373.1 hypothetical protein HWC31_gp035 [Aeromonas phage LAh_8]YP_009847511.1 hypothetical protein HWC32_gp030 [Aeromonas phage LAh_9]QDH46556.1 hypothetical protein LAh6_140 [Aeromonas phage LAh_6]QDH46792.1 hypothetical protein LAh8_35 [Aeromonas phage LAh_8]QDH46936.1 hypothetical protein LAh9_30 [Aeromonas phage LAh_9]
MNNAETLKKIISEKSAIIKAKKKTARAISGRMVSNKMLRVGLAEGLKVMKDDLKQADRDGNFELASSIRLTINSSRLEMKNLLGSWNLAKSMRNSVQKGLDALKDEIRVLDAAWEDAKAEEAAA